MELKGLTIDQVKESRKKSGANIRNTSGNTYLYIIRDVVKEPMVILLFVTCLFYFLLDENKEGMIMLVAIIIVSGISVFQQIRSENAINSLNQLTKSLVSVIRDGKIEKISSEDLVVGDVMQISEGDLIPADAKIIESNDFYVDESLLTGESIAVNKNNDKDMIYSGTTATSGMVWAEVVSVGSSTKIGMLGIVMDETLKEKTPLQQQVSTFVKKMSFFGIAAFVVVWLSDYLISKDVLDSLLRGLTLAMAILPEEIPVAMATFMALGAYKLIKNNVLARHPQTVEALGAATIICVDKTGTITENKMKVSGYYDFKNNTLDYQKLDFKSEPSKQLLQIASLASEDDPFDPMEKAILTQYHTVFNQVPGEIKIHEYPLSGKHPMMTHVFKDTSGKVIIACKGAPEGIIEQSDLTTEEKQKIESNLKQLASNGNRVLAIAKGIYDEKGLPAVQQELKLEFLGLIALNDPPKKHIKTVIKQFYDAGVGVKMITGDYPETALSIARQINLKHNDQYITGSQIDKMTDSQLQESVKTFCVFARVMPETKLKIINALKASGEVVAMTGDGVNDGPALKASHIGISMGKSGSAIARNASSLVLLNDDLSSMPNAILFGRNIYSNLKKAIQYIISIHIPLISIVTIPIILNWKLPDIFSPVHVIFLELIMGPTCSIVYENEPIDKSLGTVKPRKLTDSLFTWSELSISVIQGLIIAAGILSFAYFLVNNQYSEMYIRSMTFTTLVFSNIMLTLTGRSNSKTLFTTIKNKNKLIPIIITITLLLLFMGLYYSPAQAVFQFVSLTINDFIKCLLVSIPIVIWIDLWKVKFTVLKNKNSSIN